jgi:hypothetical protein
LIAVAGGLLGLTQKKGVLVGKDWGPEPSLAWELFETKGKDWLRSGWSLDAITTNARGSLGIAKDVYEGIGLEVDLGAYVTQEYEGLLKGKLDPRLGVGLNIRF